jgi:hypothetical protein
MGTPNLEHSEQERARVQGCLSVMLVGSFLSALFSAVIFTTCCITLDSIAVPPLSGVGNYGQFGFLVAYIAFFGGVAGACAGILTLSRVMSIPWIPIVLVIRIAAVSSAWESLIPSFNNVIFVSQCLLDVVLLIGGIIFSLLYNLPRR